MKFFTNSALTLISILLVVISFEFYTEFYLKKKNFIENPYENYDFRSKFQVYDDMLKEGKEVAIYIEPYSFTYVNFDNYLNGINDGKNPQFLETNLRLKKPLWPLSGISNKLSILCNEMGDFTIFKTDRYGFRNPNNAWNDDELDILLLGDSYGQGFCVKDEETIASRLRNKHNLKILNFSSGGNGQLEQLATLMEFGKLRQFKHIIILYYEGNDLDNLEDTFKLSEDGSYQQSLWALNYFTDPTYNQDLPNRVKESDELSRARIQLQYLRYAKMRKKQLINEKDEIIRITKLQNKPIKEEKFNRILKLKNTQDLIKKTLDNKHEIEVKIQTMLSNDPFEETEIVEEKELYDKKDLYNDRTYEIFEKLITKINLLTKEKNAKLHFIYLPELARYSQNRITRNLSRIKIRKIIMRNKIDFIDLDKEMFRKIKNPEEYFPFKRMGHYNPQAYEKIADILKKKVYDQE